MSADFRVADQLNLEHLEVDFGAALAELLDDDLEGNRVVAR